MKEKEKMRKTKKETLVEESKGRKERILKMMDNRKEEK